jgi:TrmH family RNA methyltransferase
MFISSSANPHLKHARRVREGRDGDLIFVEGERLIEECLASGLALRAAFHTAPVSPRAQEILDQLRDRACPLYETSASALAGLSDTVNPQGLILLAERPGYSLEEALEKALKARPGEALLLVALDQVQDPGNLGSIIRSSEAAGIGAVLSIEGTTGAFSPKALRSAMGSSFRLPVVAGLAPKDLLECRARGLKIVGADADGPIIYSDYDFRAPTLLAFGNEARGLSEELRAECDLRLRIPLASPVESLNVAASAAALLFEAARQRRAAAGN